MIQENETVLWDFDGVILDSMAVRDWGFREIFKNFSEKEVSQLIKYHRINGGLSRYVKIRYFYEVILQRTISEERVLEYAEAFSQLMKKELIKKENLILDAVQFIENNYHQYNFHIVSGSDQKELRYLCKVLEIDNYFLSIHGSPTVKNKLVANLISEHDYSVKKTCLIGDSINDYEAAKANNIAFYGYNNNLLKDKDSYISSFQNLI